MSSSVPKLRFCELQQTSAFRIVAKQIREAGALLITEIGDLESLREDALKAIRKLAFVSEEAKEKYSAPDLSYSIGWSRGKERLEGGESDTSKGSFYFNLSTSQSPIFEKCDQTGHQLHCLDNIWPKEVPELEPSLKKLTTLMTRTGQVLIQSLDSYLTTGVEGFRSGSLVEVFEASNTHKGRALVYYPTNVRNANWCGEHFDHGIITALIAPTYFDDQNNVVECTDDRCGLYIRSAGGEIQKVKCPQNCLLFQLGECAEILSGGALKATSHWVQPPQVPGLFRSTLAVFFNPNIDVTLNTPNDVTSQVRQFRNGQTFVLCEMGKGQRHSKNAGVMGSEGLTYHEKRALGFGTVRERVGKESQGNYYDCCLTLQPAVDPVCTPHGYLFSREAILENLLHQRKTNKRKLATWEKEQEKEEKEAQDAAQLEADAELLAFDQQNSLGLTKQRALEEQEKFKQSFQREKQETKAVKSVMNIEQNKDQIKEIKSFWHPSRAPEAKIQKEKPSMKCICPASGKPLRMNELVNVKFTPVPEKLKKLAQTQHNGNAIPLFMDPISREIFTNSTRLVLLKESGIVMTKKSYETCVKPDGIYEGKRIRDRDVIYLQTGGTGFAARDGEKAEAKRHFPLGPGSGLTDLRGQSQGPRSHGGLRFWN